MSITAAEAFAEARKWGAFVRAFEKVIDVVEFAQGVDAARGETEARLAAAKVSAGKIEADAAKAADAHRERLAAYDADLSKKDGLVAAAKREADALLVKARADAVEIIEEARRTAAANKAASAAGLTALAQQETQARATIKILADDIAKAERTLEETRGRIEDVRRQAAQLAGA